MINNKLLASTVSYLNSINYIEVSFKKKTILDKRKTKYAPIQQRNNSNSIIMGSRSKEILYSRIKIQTKQANIMQVDLSADLIQADTIQADAMQVDIQSD